MDGQTRVVAGAPEFIDLALSELGVQGNLKLGVRSNRLDAAGAIMVKI